MHRKPREKESHYRRYSFNPQRLKCVLAIPVVSPTNLKNCFVYTFADPPQLYRIRTRHGQSQAFTGRSFFLISDSSSLITLLQ
jgi:hypothetical protein